MNGNGNGTIEDINAMFATADDDAGAVVFPDRIRTGVDPLEAVSDEEAARRAAEIVGQQAGEQGTTALHAKFRGELERNARAIPDPDTVAAIKQSQGIEYGIWDSAAFDDADLHVDYLIDNVLAVGQPAVLAGEAKALKTSMAVDLGLSLAFCRSFLGRFWVPEEKRVLFLSAESGGATLQETGRRVAAEKGYTLRDAADRMHWGDWVPRVNNRDQLALLRYELNRTRPDVCIVDPLYMVTDGEDAANISKMGQQLRSIAEQCLEFNATPILVHHTKKTSLNSSTRSPLEPSDLSGAGVTEFFRQWCLVNRREQYDPEQPHRLWLSIGGSAGHGGAWALDIDERRDEDGKRQWGVELNLASDARKEAAQREQQKKAERDQMKKEAQGKQHQQAVVDALRSGDGQPMTKRAIRDRSGLNNDRADGAIAVLLRVKAIEEAEVQKHNGKWPGYRLSASFTGLE